MSNLCTSLYIVKSLILKQSRDVIRFKYQWKNEKLKYWKVGLGPGLGLIAPLSLINLMWYNRYTTNILKIYEKYMWIYIKVYV